MTNPVTKWEMLDFSIDFDVGKLMENFFNLRSFSTFGVVHTHHIQHVTFDLDTQAIGNSTDYGPFTWPEPFASGVIPYVQATVNSVNATAPNFTVLAHVMVYDIDNTGCSVRVHNPDLAANDGAFAAGAYVALTAFDPNYNTSAV